MHSYVGDRHGFEARYDQLADTERVALALRQGASFVVAQSTPAIARAGAEIAESWIARSSCCTSKAAMPFIESGPTYSSSASDNKAAGCESSSRSGPGSARVRSPKTLVHR